MTWENARFTSESEDAGFTLRVTRNALPRLASWRRAHQRSREMSPAMRRAMVVVMLSVTAMWTVSSALSLRDWRPPFLALAGVGILFVGAVVLARVNRQPGQQRSSGLAVWLDGCPRWFEGVVFGLIVVALGTALFRFLRSLDETAAAASGWGFDPLLVFLFGGLALVFLLQMRQVGPVEDER